MGLRTLGPGAAALLALSATPAAAQDARLRPAPAIRCAEPAPAAGGVSNDHTRHVETRLLPAMIEADTKAGALAERMRLYKVPGVSVAVIQAGRIAWARGWGVRDIETCAPVDADTAFQAASISKPVAAAVAMRLVEQGKLDPGKDINAYLKGWRLPADAKFPPGTVTLRQLLSHTAGTDVHGFAGYVPGDEVPTQPQLLDGVTPANSAPVRLIQAPGGAFRYSGGGYQIAQMAMAEASGTPFDRLAAREILAPLGMKHSAYAQPPSAAIRRNIASGHAGDRVIEGRYNTYPELAAAGLWTTPSDLARFLIGVREAAAGQSAILKPATAAAMLTAVTPGYGLGLSIDGAGAARRFGHNGSNLGFKAFAILYADRGDGIVVMTNGEAGKPLADEIIRAVATDYGWAELASRSIEGVRLTPEAMARLAGFYTAGPVSSDVRIRDGALFAQTGGPVPERLVMSSPTRFTTAASGIEAEFVLGADGTATGIRVISGAPAMTLARATPPTGDIAAAPLYLRGSMNDWGTGAPLAKQPDGSFAADVALTVGDHEFKLATEDWRTTDLGAEAPPIAGETTAYPLIPHAPNIALRAAAAGTYRFVLRIAGTKATLDVVKPR